MHDGAAVAALTGDGHHTHGLGGQVDVRQRSPDHRCSGVSHSHRRTGRHLAVKGPCYRRTNILTANTLTAVGGATVYFIVEVVVAVVVVVIVQYSVV